ncbi:conserved hypothetical protein [Haliangium ochraceum DSM 14365]|uniref:Uncharacterized protein n=2 Tax=Haliangium ochraceum TaxID=80816 RepID=D0LNN6_HALO1|nr:conserved hypothetical protein [Haliangium ochraceum DSM 14365]
MKGMALEHTPLDPSTLSADEQRALAPGPTRMMAARGLVPLARPVGLVSVLYQLTLDGEAAVAQAASSTLGELPERVLSAALGDPALDRRVLDRCASAALGKPALLQRFLLNPAVADETIAELCARLDAAAIDLVAGNEERLLRHPPIIAAMYMNRAARMSTIDRAVELAVRNQVQVTGIPGWDDLAAAVLGHASDSELPPEQVDALFAQTVEEPERADQSEAAEADDSGDGDGDEDKGKKVPINRLSVPMKIRAATLGNAFIRSQLIRDPIKLVAMAAIKAPGVTDSEAAKYASNQSMSDDVVQYIANRREWTKLYGIKLSLVQNPKTPIQASARFMPHLREKDLRALARSKNIPTAVAAQARKLMAARANRNKGGNK